MKCLKCGNVESKRLDSFCRRCGTKYETNSCTNKDCRGFDVFSEIQQTTICDADDCYCYACGSETVFFREGLIKKKSLDD